MRIKHIILLAVLLSCAFHLSYAQTNRDSLFALIKPDVLDSVQWKLRMDLSASYVYSNPDSSLLLLNDAMEIARSVGSQYLITKTLSDLAVTYFYKSEYEKSLENHLASLRISQENGYLELASTTLSNIGMLYSERKDNEKAVGYYRESLKLKRQLEDSMGIARALNNIGMSYFNIANLDSAEYFYLQALDIARALEVRYGEGLLLNNLGSIYFNREMHAMAIDYYRQALEVKKSIDDVKGMAMVNNNIGSVYIKEEQPDSASLYYKTGLALARKSASRSNEAESLEGLYRASGLKGNYQDALDYLVRFKQLSDSLQQEIYSDQIGELETRFETQKKEAEISRLQNENALAGSRQKNLILLFSLGTLLIISAGVFIFMRVRSIQQRRTIQMEKERIEELARINAATHKFVPMAFLGALGCSRITDVGLGDFTEREVTVFFSDIRNYTALAEAYGPGGTFEFIKSYSQLIGPIVTEHGGFINQYVGDGVYALFPGSSSDGLKAAIAMQKNIQAYNETRKERGENILQVGMGLHTGPLIMGIVGDEERFEPAVISDTVNTAARLDVLTKQYGANILVTEHIANPGDHTPENSFGLRYLGKVLVKGKSSAVGIYECFDGDAPAIQQKKRESLEEFREAIGQYFSLAFAKAESSFEKIVRFNPGDMVSKFFLEKSKQYQLGHLPVGWTGVEVMQEK